MKVVSLFSGAGGGSSGIAHIQFHGIDPKVLTRVFLTVMLPTRYVLL